MEDNIEQDTDEKKSLFYSLGKRSMLNFYFLSYVIMW
jgi:hypothetical protein